MDMIINLRYYYEYWQRAKTYAHNLQFIFKAGDAKRTKMLRDSLIESGVSTKDEHGDEKFFD